MNLYVSNLSYQMSDAELRAAFEIHGTVTSARVITDRDTGRSRGFGFVEMPVETEALSAINALNNQAINGRPVKVVEARPKEERPRRDFSGGGGGGGGGGRKWDRGDRGEREEYRK
ncbi:MAG: RNA-binding protein [Verrucomicrobiaceae bacterium]|nr:RNA-binding protein [Verrucomicrobiaceae bacterium]